MFQVFDGGAATRKTGADGPRAARKVTTTTAIDPPDDGHHTMQRTKSAGRLALRSLALRLVAGTLAVSVPLTLALAFLLTNGSSTSLGRAAGDKGQSVAQAITLRLEDWLSERRSNLALLAGEASGHFTDGTLATTVAEVHRFDSSFAALEVADLTGRRIAAVPAEPVDSPESQDWFRTAAAGTAVITSLQQEGNKILWVMAQPVLGPDGRPEGVVIGDLRAENLGDLLNPELIGGSEVMALDRENRLVYSTRLGRLGDDAALIGTGVLQQRFDNNLTRVAATTERGSARYTEAGGSDAIAGFDHVDSLHWTIVAQDKASAVLAPVRRVHQRAWMLVVVGILASLAVSIGLARRTTRPIRRLTDAARHAADGRLDTRVECRGAAELVVLGEAFNAMLATCQQLIEQLSSAGIDVNAAAAELSASSDELAATTTQQSAAVVEASVTTEELARASAAIADTVDEVARQTADTRDNLEQAESDIQTSSERTLELARRVNEIERLLALINDIADQTDLLALNAAIEAARAGDEGRGFAVVAEEVRRLAERSKSSASDIAHIIDAVQTETNATVMSMEKGAKQMQQGLTLLDHVTDATSQVRQTTHQQRAATAQVVETMEQLSEASRQVSITAQQIASSAGNLADLAGQLESTAAGATRGTAV
jgi:methyl-accepting chemotaxis protein